MTVKAGSAPVSSTVDTAMGVHCLLRIITETLQPRFIVAAGFGEGQIAIPAASHLTAWLVIDALAVLDDFDV